MSLFAILNSISVKVAIMVEAYKVDIMVEEYIVVIMVEAYNVDIMVEVYKVDIIVDNGIGISVNTRVDKGTLITFFNRDYVGVDIIIFDIIIGINNSI